MSTRSGSHPSPMAMPRPICATSSECVSRVRGVSPWRGPTTCVLSASRRRAALCRTRARSRAKSVRCSLSVPGRAAPFGGSTTNRRRSNSLYGSPFTATDAQSASTTLTTMRIARLLGLIVAVLTVGVLLAPTAAGQPPFRLPTYVNDNAHALSGSELSDVRQAVDKLYNDRHIRLWVVYVETFSGQDAVGWTQQTGRLSDISGQDAILAVAIQDRAYAFLPPTTASGGFDVTSLRTTRIEPKLRQSDWAGA